MLSVAEACLVDNNYFYTIPVDSHFPHHLGSIHAHLFNRVLQIAQSDTQARVHLIFALFILNAVSLFKFMH